MKLDGAKHQLQMFQDMMQDGEDLKRENDRFRIYIKDFWADSRV